VQGALVEGPVAEKAERHAPVLSVGLGQGHPRGHGYLCAHDAVAPEHALDRIEEVHRPALPSRYARRLAEELGHDGAGIHAEGEGVAVVPVAG